MASDYEVTFPYPPRYFAENYFQNSLIMTKRHIQFLNVRLYILGAFEALSGTVGFTLHFAILSLNHC